MNLQMKRFTLVLSLLLIMAWITACSPQPQSPTVFETPEAAVQALSELIGQRDEQQVEQMFGPGSADLFHSGDDEADREDYQRVKAMIAEGVVFDDYDENTRIALLGEDAWPLPFPLVREGDGWRFDTAEGREELLNRRIGRNELWTLTALHEVVDAQNEYRSESRDGRPPAFAQRFLSTEGQHDGLYWATGEGDGLSPLGELLAESDVTAGEPRPFQGYYYRMLTRRGPDAPGGERDYLDENGMLTRGFGVIAWPARYGNSGVMTFMVNHRGLVFQKDLGAETDLAVAKIDSYNPDSSWAPTDDSLFGIEE